MPVKKANEFGMITFVWGEDLDKKENINYFKELEVDGVIHDRIGKEERRSNVFIVEREQKRALLSCSGTSTPQRAPSPSPVSSENNNSSPPTSAKFTREAGAHTTATSDTAGKCSSTHAQLCAPRKSEAESAVQHHDENQVLLRLHGNARKFYKSSKERKNCRVKLTPWDVGYKQPTSGHVSLRYGKDEEDDEEDSTVLSNKCTHSATHVAVLSDPRPEFHDQEETGVVFNYNKDYLVFRTHSLAVEFLAFYIKFFSEERKRIGACYALPSSLQDASGTIHLPFINSSGRPIGQVSIEYLCVRALTRLGPQLMNQAFCRHWKKRNALESSTTTSTCWSQRSEALAAQTSDARSSELPTEERELQEAGEGFNSEDLLKDQMPVKKTNQFGMVTFVWGEDLDKKENINYFKKELVVDGIIYDRIGEEERRRNVFIVEREQKRALLSCSGTSTPQRAPSPSPVSSENNNSSPPTSANLTEKTQSDPALTEENEENKVFRQRSETVPSLYHPRLGSRPL